MSREEHSFALPAPGNAGWNVVFVVGVALMSIAGMDVMGSPALTEAAPLSYLGFGAGLFLSCFAIAVRVNRELASQLKVRGDMLTVTTADKDTVDMPLAALSGVEATVNSRQTGGPVLTLRKKDGGLIELCAFGDESAVQEVVDVLRAAIDAADPKRKPDPDPIGRLDAIKGIAVERRGQSLELWWRAGASPKTFIALGPMLGMFIISFGFHRYQPGAGSYIAMGFSLLLVAVVVVATAWSIGNAQHVSIDGDLLTIERRRFGRSSKRDQAPLSSVVSVDYTHQLHVSGAMLTVRTGAGRERKNQAMEKAGKLVDEQVDADGDMSLEGGIAFTAQVLALMSSGLQISLGRLPLAAKIALDLALSEEIARRCGRASGQV